MTLSPLVILILLLFVMVIAFVFLIWSFFNLRPAGTNTPRKTTVKREEDNKSGSTQTFIRQNSEEIKPREQKRSREKQKKRQSRDQSRGLRVSPPPIPAPTPTPVEATITKKHEPRVAKLMVQETSSSTSGALEPTPIKSSESVRPSSIETAQPEFYIKPPSQSERRPQTFPKIKDRFVPDSVIPEPEKPEPAEKIEAPRSELSTTEAVKPKRKVPKFVVVDTETSTSKPASTKKEQASEAKNDKSDYDEDAFDRFIRSKNDDLNFE